MLVVGVSASPAVGMAQEVTAPVNTPFSEIAYHLV